MSTNSTEWTSRRGQCQGRGLILTTTSLLARPFLESWPGCFAKRLGEVLALKIYRLVSAAPCELPKAKHTMPLPLP